MALSIKDPEADRLARAVAEQTGESLTQAIVVALRERLERTKRRRGAPQRLLALRALRQSMKALPILSTATEADILGYGEDGLPGTPRNGR